MKGMGLIRALRAEYLKIKRTPLPWLILIGGTGVAILLFIVYFTNPIRFTMLNKNLWVDLFRNGYVIVSMVLLLPYIVLVTSIISQLEQRADAWKYLYSLPIYRGHIYISKHLLAIILILVTYVSFIISLLGGGYLLGVLRPELEFHYYSPQIGRVVKNLGHSFFSIAGVVAIQFWLNSRWKHYVVSIGFGLMGFIASLVMFERTSWAVYFPYCYHLYLQDASLGQWGGLSEVEYYSLICFAIFFALTMRHELRKEITS